MPDTSRVTIAIVHAIRDCLKDKGLESADVRLDTPVDSTLGLDSLDWAAIVVTVEDDLGVDPFATGVDRELKTVKDLVEVYEAALS
jgi:acyl carrier protein